MSSQYSSTECRIQGWLTVRSTQLLTSCAVMNWVACTVRWDLGGGGGGSEEVCSVRANENRPETTYAPEQRNYSTNHFSMLQDSGQLICTILAKERNSLQVLETHPPRWGRRGTGWEGVGFTLKFLYIAFPITVTQLKHTPFNVLRYGACVRVFVRRGDGVFPMATECVRVFVRWGVSTATECVHACVFVCVRT